jgi:CheY-like chemotaxis protein
MDRNARRVLVIEDDPDTAEQLVDCLRASGYTVDLARDGQQGLALGRGAEYVVMTVDRMLPRFDGIEVIRRLRDDGIVTPTLRARAQPTLAPSGSGCPPRGPRPRGVICQTQTPAAPGAPATVDVGQLLGQHHRVAERREQDRGPQAHPRGDPGQVGRVVTASSRGLATTLSPTQTAS